MRKMIFVGRIMSSPDGDSNVRGFVGDAMEIVAELYGAGFDSAVGSDSRLNDGEHLAFGDNVINVDEYRLEFARCG